MHVVVGMRIYVHIHAVCVCVCRYACAHVYGHLYISDSVGGPSNTNSHNFLIKKNLYFKV